MKKTGLKAMLLSVAFAALTAQAALASTPPCTPINNTATVDYNVGGVTQPTEDGDAPEFNVGVKVMVAVANGESDEVTVVPSTTLKYALKFTVTNNGSAEQNYDLDAEAAVDGTPTPDTGGANDSFDGEDSGTVLIYADTVGGTAGAFDATDLTAGPITTLENVARDGGSKVVFIVYSPTSLQESNGATAVYFLKATSKWANNSVIAYGATQTVTAAQAGGVCEAGGTVIPVVAGDVDGPATDDTLNDGEASDVGAYEVSSATISVTKDSNVIWDPINLNDTPKAIPGALVQYVITISNAVGAAPATLSTIIDNLTTNLQIDPDLKVASAETTIAALTSTSADGSGFKVVQPSGRPDPDTNYYTTTTSVDGVDHNNTNPGGAISANMALVLPAEDIWGAGELKAGESVTLTFNAIIQ